MIDDVVSLALEINVVLAIAEARRIEATLKVSTLDLYQDLGLALAKDHARNEVLATQLGTRGLALDVATSGR